MLALKQHMICFENLYEFTSVQSKLPNLLSVKDAQNTIFIGENDQFEYIKSVGTQFKSILNKLCIVDIEKSNEISEMLSMVKT